MNDGLYYFGCVGQAGHFLWDTRLRHVWDKALPADFPVDPNRLDGGFFPGGRVIDDPQGAVYLTHRKGWTVACFADRSVDRRGNSNSAFVARGTHTVAEMVALARAHFPSVVARFPFELREAVRAPERKGGGG